MVERDFSKIPESDVLVNAVSTRRSKGLGTNIFVIGMPGTGKSSASIRFGELICESYEEEISLHVVDSLFKLVRAIKNSKRGDVIIIEEVSVLFPSRRAMAGDNVMIGKLFDTVRKRLLTIISNAPIYGAIDSHMRALGHYLVETIKILKKEKVVISKIHRTQTNSKSGKTYFHTMTRKGRDVNQIYTRKPNSEVWDNYEREKDKFIDKLYLELEHNTLKQQIKLDKELGRFQQPDVKTLTPRELQVHSLVNLKGMNQREAGVELGVAQQTISKMIKSIFEKSKGKLEKANSHTT